MSTKIAVTWICCAQRGLAAAAGIVGKALSSGAAGGNPGGVLEASDNFDSVLVVFVGPRADPGDLCPSL
jgi:hypothetical protein